MAAMTSSANTPYKSETAVRVSFLVLSAGHDRYGLANRGAVCELQWF